MDSKLPEEKAAPRLEQHHTEAETKGRAGDLGW